MGSFILKLQLWSLQKKKKRGKKNLKEREIFTLILYLQDTKKKKIKKIEIYFGGIHQID